MIYLLKKGVVMDGILYPVSIVVLALFAFTFHKSNNTILAMIMVVVGIYIIYSQETGHTATEFKRDMVDSANEAVGNSYSKDLSTGKMR